MYSCNLRVFNRFWHNFRRIRSHGRWRCSIGGAAQPVAIDAGAPRWRRWSKRCDVFSVISDIAIPKKIEHRTVFLVGGLEHFLNFHFIYGMSSFPLTFIFFRGVGQPPTSFQMNFRISRFSNFHIVGSSGSTVDVSLWEFVTGKTARVEPTEFSW